MSRRIINRRTVCDSRRSADASAIGQTREMLAYLHNSIARYGKNVPLSRARRYHSQQAPPGYATMTVVVAASGKKEKDRDRDREAISRADLYEVSSIPELIVAHVRK